MARIDADGDGIVSAEEARAAAKSSAELRASNSRLWKIVFGVFVLLFLSWLGHHGASVTNLEQDTAGDSLETCGQAGDGGTLPGAALLRSMPRPGGLPSAAQLAVAGVILLVLSRTHSCLLEIGACAIWVVSRTCAAGGLLHVHVPLLGYFRIDLAMVLLAGQGLVVVGLRQLHRRLPLLLVVSLALISRAALPHPAVRYSTRNSPARDASLEIAADSEYNDWYYGAFEAFRTQGVSSTPAALSARECERIFSHVLDHHADWTHANVLAPLPYFSFGLNSNHVAARSSAPAWWSADFGFSAAEGNEGAFALSDRPAYMVYRERARSVMRDAAWLNEPIRSAFARHLGVSTSQIVFGGEGVISHLYNPAVQIYLPNLAFALIFNPHKDEQIYLQEADGVPCDDASRTALLLPLHAPPGAGLHYWNHLHPDGSPSELPVEHVPSRPLQLPTPPGFAHPPSLSRRLRANRPKCDHPPTSHPATTHISHQLHSRNDSLLWSGYHVRGRHALRVAALAAARPSRLATPRVGQLGDTRHGASVRRALRRHVVL